MEENQLIVKSHKREVTLQLVSLLLWKIENMKKIQTSKTTLFSTLHLYFYFIKTFWITFFPNISNILTIHHAV